MGNLSRIILLIFCCATALAQERSWRDALVLTGSLQSDMLVPTGIQDDGSNEDFRTNTFLDLNLAVGKTFDIGGRFEYLEHPLPGFERDYRGWGFPNIFAKWRPSKSFELTIGNFYEQFGSGFILRTYEERSLGIDNSIFGGRVVYRPYKGIQAKMILGKQRRYWDKKKDMALIGGVDAELNIDQFIMSMAESGMVLSLGGSWVNKNEDPERDEIFADATHKLNLPRHVNAWDGRINFQLNGFSLNTEYARKSQDPSLDNGFIYHKGDVAMFSASYSKRGMSVLVQAKRSEDFSFRSIRTMNGISAFINHLPAFTEDHTYTLASLYPFTTHPGGEWAYQGQIGYNFKRNTAFGGKYGTNIKINFSHVHSIKKNPSGSTVFPNLTAGTSGTDGYTSPFWKWGDETYYQDLNIKMEKRLTKDFRLTLLYMNQLYNKTVVEGEGGMVHSDIFVAEGLYKFSPKFSLRGEAQYLCTKEDRGDWAFGLVEMSVAPHWMFTLADTYNCGKAHYWQTMAIYNYNSHRLQLAWGRTRAGYNCSGGVCRYVPETKGFTLSYNYNF